MARSRLQHVRAGDTEPIDITIGATGLSDLDNLTTATLYARKQGAATNHVDGGTLTIKDSALKSLSFDPVGQKLGGGDAFGAGDDGLYDCYVLVVWADGDQTRHPSGPDFLELNVTENLE